MSDLDRKEIDRLKEKLTHAVAQRDEAREQRDRHKAWSATAMEQRKALQTEVWALQAQMNALREEMNALRAPPPAVKEVTVPPGLPWPPVEPPSFFADHLAVWHKLPSFAEEERFQRAYRRGMDSGHHIVRPKGSTLDLHIEWRIHVVLWAAAHGAMLEGDFVECGVNTGIQSLAICDFLDFNSLPKQFWLFDTYAGLPAEQLSPEEAAGTGESYKEYYSECYELAKANFAPWPQARLVRGKVPESLATVEIERVAYLSLDMNIAYPEIEALKHFWPKLVPGAIVVLDDYGWGSHTAQKRAIDEFAAAQGVSVVHLPTGQGLMIKSPST